MYTNIDYGELRLSPVTQPQQKRRKGKKPIQLTAWQREWLIRNYQHHSTNDIAEVMGINTCTVRKLARQAGFVRKPQRGFLREKNGCFHAQIVVGYDVRRKSSKDRETVEQWLLERQKEAFDSCKR